MTTLFVGNLSPEATDGDLRTVFSVFGEIGSIKVARNRAGRRRGYAYVELEDEAAAAAVEALRGTELKGHVMDVVVEQASPARRRQGPRGGRSGFRRRR